MSKKNRLVCYSDFYCLNCNSKITLSRRVCAQREKYHIKDIFCHNCKEITPHIEVRQNDFSEEVLQYANEHKEELIKSYNNRRIL